MDNLRKVLFLCLSVLQVIADDYNRKFFNTANGEYNGTIACTNSNISINKISISDNNASCQVCEIDQTDVDSIKHNCNGFSNCSLDLDFKTTCLKEVKPHPYFNISYVCTPQKTLFCNFETSFCNWINVNVSRTKASDNGNPNNDHTTQSGYGHYVYVNQSSLDKLMLLKSQQMVSYIPKCLKFWYYIAHATLEIYQKNNTDSTDMIPIWQDPKREMRSKSSWTEGVVSINGIGIYEIIIGGNQLKQHNTLIAIDDINVFNVPCENSSEKFCNFENGTCGFTVQPKVDKKWELANATYGTNRPLDHTTNSPYGHYLYFEVNTIQHPTFETCIIVPQIVPKENGCFSFWYYTSRSNTGKLNIYGTDVDNTEHHLLTVSNTGELEWYSVSIDVPNIQKVTLRYSFTNQTIAFIALDDIYISDSACADISPVVHSTIITPTQDTNIINQASTRNSTGFIVGVTVGICIAVAVIVLVILIVRQRRVLHNKNNQDDTSDLAGYQNIALPQTTHLSFSGSYEELQTRYNEHSYCDIKEHTGAMLENSAQDVSPVYENREQTNNVSLSTGNDTSYDITDYLNPSL